MRSSILLLPLILFTCCHVPLFLTTFSQFVLCCAGAKAEAGARAEEAASEGREAVDSEFEGEEAAAAGLEAPVEILEQMLQASEQDMDAADGAVAEMRGMVLGGKKKREEELDGQPARHSLWEQGVDVKT